MAHLPWSTATRHADGGICFCCRRRDSGIGYLRNSVPVKIIWSCDDHISFIRKALAMAQDQFDIYERRALTAAGAMAGKMLIEKFNCTDLAQLTPEEWMQFCETLVRSFGDDLARRLSDTNEIPF